MAACMASGAPFFFPMDEPLPAIVAAAGRSARMGSSKPLLDAGGRSFLARILRAFQDGGVGPVLVVVRELDGPEGEEAEAAGGLPVLNPDPGPGPISSLQAGILRLPAEVAGTFYCPADHPLFSPETVRALARAFREGRAEVLAPTYWGQRGHPVIFRRSLFPELLEDNLPEGARTVVRRYLHSRAEIPVNDPGVLADIDTPADYRRHFPE